jgi:hypothetical protein
MATDSQKYETPVEREPRHSALAEFGRDERKPAVLLLSALLLSALFFGIGLMVGRWTAEPASPPAQASNGASSTQLTSTPTPQPQTSPSTTTASAGERAMDSTRRFAVLVATYDTSEKAQSLIKSLEEAGYRDVRSSSPRAGETRPKYSVLVGRFTQDEARASLQRMRNASDPRLRNARVIEDGGQ